MKLFKSNYKKQMNCTCNLYMHNSLKTIISNCYHKQFKGDQRIRLFTCKITKHFRQKALMNTLDIDVKIKRQYF